MPPTTVAPKQLDPNTECGSRPSCASVLSSCRSLAPGRQIACRPSLTIKMRLIRMQLIITTSRSSMPSSGVEPPVSPVFAACMNTAFLASIHRCRTLHISTSEPGRTTANARPVLPRNPVRKRRVGEHSVSTYRSPTMALKEATNAALPVVERAFSGDTLMSRRYRDALTFTPIPMTWYRPSPARSSLSLPYAP